MKYLKQLVGFVNKNKAKQIAILDTKQSPPTKPSQLYQAISEGLIDNDVDGANLLYGNGRDERYYKVKQLLKKQLLNTVFFIDLHQKGMEKNDKHFYNCLKNYCCAEILWRRGYRELAVNLLKNVVKNGKKFEFTEIVVGASRYLRYYYGLINFSQRDYDLYRKTCRNWMVIRDEEERIRERYELLLVNFVNTAKPQADVNRQTNIILEEILTEGRSVDTLNYHFFLYFIKVIKYMSEHSYECVIRTCKDAIAYMDGKEFARQAYYRMFLLQIISASIQMKFFEEGELAVQRYTNYVYKNSISWFKVKELNVLLSFHTGRYERANEVIEEITEKASFKGQAPADQERWTLLQAYFHWIEAIGKVNGNSNGMGDYKQNRKFRLQKFLNEVPIFSQDKKGLNIPILIIQCLWLITKKKYDDARNRIKYLERYDNRYLKKRELKRTHYFIKMICQIEKGNFHKVAAQRKAERYQKKLNSLPLPTAQQSVGIEIIPYETLWSYIIQELSFEMW